MTFQTGDTVKMKSGGPLMTIRSYDEESDNYCCEWFSGENFYSRDFPALMLEATKSERSNVGISSVEITRR